MNFKSSFMVQTGMLYRGEIIHSTLVAVVVFPTWLDGKQVNYNDLAEAKADIDAHMVEPVCFSCFQNSTSFVN